MNTTERNQCHRCHATNTVFLMCDSDGFVCSLCGATQEKADGIGIQPLDHGAALRANLVTHKAKQFALGAEVMVIDEGVIAAGQKGTIVAFHPHMQKYEISFDEQWRGWYPVDALQAVESENLVTQSKPETKQEELLPMNVQRAQECIREECAALANFLCGKNAAYGNSAFEPLRVFSTSCPLEQIRVRLDDKLSRLMKGHGYPGDNDKKDLLGYMLLERAVERYQQAESQCEKEIEPESETGPEPELESFYGFTIGQRLVNKHTGKNWVIHKFRADKDDIILNSDGVLSAYSPWTVQAHWEPVEQPEDWNGVTVGQKLVNKHTGKTATVQAIRDDDKVVLSNDDPLAIHQSSLYSMNDIKEHWETNWRPTK